MQNLFDMHWQCEPYCLYTYETAFVQQLICSIKSNDQVYLDFKAFVSEHFGPQWMDNKIVVQCLIENPESHEAPYTSVFISFHDDRIRIGLGILLNVDVKKPEYAHRVVKPLKNK